MTSKNHFNLIDEPWIPVVDAGRVSLKQIFSNSSYRALGGNPIQKIALTKLLLAIAQAAYTPADDDDWAQLGADGMTQKCLIYLEQWHDRFWLYGEKPFLQVPEIISASLQSFGAVLPEIATGNTTVLTQSNMEQPLSDAEKSMLIVVLMGFGLGGKKTDNSVVLSPEYREKTNEKGKPSTSKPGPAVGFMGFMHNFLLAESLQDTLWINIFTQEQINQLAIYPSGIGIAPWQAMPKGEACAVAKQLQQSLMGRLVPISRFCLLDDGGLHYSEGIAHSDYKEGVVDPTVAINFSMKAPKVLWVDPERRPWRQLTSLLSFMHQSSTSSFECYQIRGGISRARKHLLSIGIWSGGLKVSSNAGEQYVSGSDDFVDSVVMLQSEFLSEKWYDRFKVEIIELEDVAKSVYGATINFYKTQSTEGKRQAGNASNLFWQLCEDKLQDLINICYSDKLNESKSLRKIFARFAQKTYDTFCAKDTARQLDAWAKNKPKLGKYLSSLKKETYE